MRRTGEPAPLRSLPVLPPSRHQLQAPSCWVCSACPCHLALQRHCAQPADCVLSHVHPRLSCLHKGQLKSSSPTSMFSLIPVLKIFPSFTTFLCYKSKHSLSGSQSAGCCGSPTFPAHWEPVLTYNRSWQRPTWMSYQALKRLSE